MNAYQATVQPGDCLDVAGHIVLVLAVYQSGWDHPILWSPRVDTVLYLRDQRVIEQRLQDFVMTNWRKVKT